MREIRVPRPIVESIRRSVPGQLSAGDYGIASTTTGLIDFIEALEAAGVSDVSDYSLPHSVPFQLSGTVADALLAPTRTLADVGWAAFRIDVSWSAVPKRNEEIRARTQAEHVSTNLVRFSTVAKCRGTTCAVGRIQYVRVMKGVNLATNSMISESAKVEQQHSGDLDSRYYSPFLMRLLMNPILGGSEPLGRRLHPLGTVPLAAAVFQARRQDPGLVVLSATMRYLAPLANYGGFTTRTQRKRANSVEVSMTNAEGLRFVVCRLWLRLSV